MTLLEAVNLCLRSTGETGVTTINSAHPKVATILASISATSQREQKVGRWFNTAVRTLPATVGGPDDGKVDVSAYDFVSPVSRGLDGGLFPRGDFLYDANADTDVLGRAVQAKVRWLYPDTDDGWAQMPASYTDYIGYAAALEFASNYDADPQQIAKLEKAMARAYTIQNRDHIRYSKLNLYWQGTTGNALTEAFGWRYMVNRSMR